MFGANVLAVSLAAGSAAGVAAPAALGAGGAMLITIGVVFLGLILLERWQNSRRKRRDAERLASGAETEEQQKARKEAEGRTGLWGALFGPAAGEETPYDPMQDIHPDELEGNYDGDPPTQSGS